MGVWGEEEGALEFGGGGYCLVEGSRSSLGEEQVALGEVGEDLFEKFGEVQGAEGCCVGGGCGGHAVVNVFVHLVSSRLVYLSALGEGLCFSGRLARLKGLAWNGQSSLDIRPEIAKS